MEYDLIALGKRLFIARKNKKLLQGEVSKMIGMDQSSLSQIEHGKKRIYTDDLYKLSKIYGVPLSWLVGDNAIPHLTEAERLEVDKFIRFIISIRNK